MSFEIDLPRCRGRQQRLIELQNKPLTILTVDELRKVGEFDPSYLYMDRQPE